MIAFQPIDPDIIAWLEGRPVQYRDSFMRALTLDYIRRLHATREEVLTVANQAIEVGNQLRAKVDKALAEIET